MFEIRRYVPEYTDEWNQFVAESKNGVFLFDRRYMDYHADRFCDHSLMFYLGGRLLAVLPAHLSGDTLCSHADELPFDGCPDHASLPRDE